MSLVASERWARQPRLGGGGADGLGEAHDSSNFVTFEAGLTAFPWVRESTGARSRRRTGRSRCRRRRGVRCVRARGAHDLRGDGAVRPGRGARRRARGETALGGRIPINTSGGRLSLGHPPQATPLLELQEVCEQLTGEAAARQVNDAAVGLVQAEHGAMNGVGRRDPRGLTVTDPEPQVRAA